MIGMLSKDHKLRGSARCPESISLFCHIFVLLLQVLDDFREGLGISGAVLPLTALTSDVSNVTSTIKLQVYFVCLLQKDALILEDHSGRVTLGGQIRPQIPHLVSGIIIAIKGSLSEAGEFLVRH